MAESIDADAMLLNEVERLYSDPTLKLPTEGTIINKLNDLRGQDLSGLSSGAAAVYGEILSPELLFRSLDLTKADRFADLGSGRGTIVLAAAMRQAGPVPAESLGVEMIAARHEAAQGARQLAPSSVQKVCAFELGDALQSDLSRTTKIFICNATFSDDLTNRFANALSPHRAPALDRVATIRPLTDGAQDANQLVLLRVSAVNASWARLGTTLYVYGRAKGPDTHGRADTVKPADVVDEAAKAMLASRNAADRRAMQRASERPDVSAGEAERNSLRTALMAAALM